MSDSKTERDRQREATRARLFEAALEAFRAHGVDGAKIDAIAQDAGVSRASFYFHFPSRDHVLLEAMMLAELKVVDQLAALPSPTPLADVLRLVADATAERWANDPVLLAATGTVALRQTAEGDLSETVDRHPLQAALVPWFAAGQQAGAVAAAIPAHLLAQFFLVNLFGAALAWAGNPVVPLGTLLERVVTFFLRGARPL